MGRSRLAIGAAVAAVILAGVGVSATLLLRAHTAPPQLALGTPSPAGSPSALDGTWSVGSGSIVGYRVKEKFINQPAETEAVARTSSVNGSLMVAVQGSTVRISQMNFTVDLASLASQDRYATYQAYQRDFFIRNIYLETSRFPTATFDAAAFSFSLAVGRPVSVDIDGKLTLHGVTRDVTAHAQAQSAGSQAEVAGSITLDMRDFGIDPPNISFTRSEPVATIEYDLKLTHA